MEARKENDRNSGYTQNGTQKFIDGIKPREVLVVNKNNVNKTFYGYHDKGCNHLWTNQTVYHGKILSNNASSTVHFDMLQFDLVTLN